MNENCDCCKKEFHELDLFHYEQFENGVAIEVVVCENCLFDLVEKEFCTEDF